MMSQITLLGAHVLSADLSTLDNGNAVCSLRVSGRVARKQRDGEEYAPTEIFELNCWGAEFAAKVLDAFPKGSKVSMTGRIHSVSTYMKKDGTPGATINVVVDQIAWPARPANGVVPTHRTPEEPEVVKTAGAADFDF